jgi:ribosomal protection tetracycline resistance protein
VSLGDGRKATVTAVEVFEPGGAVRRDRALAGQIARVRGLEHARIGDWIGRRPPSARAAALPEPGLEARVTARDPAVQDDLHHALAELADIDPLIAVRPDRGAARIRLYGEVQQEVLADTLATEYGIDVDFHDTTVVCVERPLGVGAAALRLGEPGHLYHYGLGVRVEPAIPGAGVELVVAADRASLPLHVYGNVDGYRAAIREYLDEPLAAGPLGWPVTDVRVTVTESGYPPAGPRAVDVRRTTDLVVREAVQAAGTQVCEPVDHFWLEVPTDTLSNALSLLGRHSAVPDPLQTAGAVAVITGTVRATEVNAMRLELHAATHGEGVLESTLDHYEPVRNSHQGQSR